MQRALMARAARSAFLLLASNKEQTYATAGDTDLNYFIRRALLVSQRKRLAIYRQEPHMPSTIVQSVTRLGTRTRHPEHTAPRWKDVANTSGMTATALRVWLQSSHPTMPNIILEPNDMSNVVAYILSLKN